MTARGIRTAGRIAGTVSSAFPNSETNKKYQAQHAEEAKWLPCATGLWVVLPNGKYSAKYATAYYHMIET